MIPRILHFGSGLAAAVLLLAGQDPPRPEAPVEAATEPKRPAGNGPSQPVTRERVLAHLDAIARGAQRLTELSESEEGRMVAERIRWLAASLHDDIEASTPGRSASEGPGDPGNGGGDEGQSGERADPKRWRAVRAPEVRSGEWGGFPTKGPSAVTAERRFIGQHFRFVSRGGAVLVTPTALMKDYVFKDCIIEGAPDRDGVIKTRWGVRAYDVIDWKFLHCEFRNIPDEHGCYLSAPGSVLWSRCRFENIGSQAIQVVYRWQPPNLHETTNPALRDIGGLQHVQECLVLEVGKPSGGRPSYALSFFEGPRCDVKIERCFIQTLGSQHLSDQGLPCASFGAIMVHDRPRVELFDNFVNYRKPDRDVIQIWNVEEVVIEGCEVTEGLIELRNCGKVRVRGNRGGARLRVGTGPAYTWPMQNVRHEGPLTQDYEH